MFEHARIQRLLSSYHDGELSPAAAVRVEQHLEGCGSCGEEYARLTRASNAVRDLHRVEAPASLTRLIRRRIDIEIRGMVPILRGELLSCRPRPILVPALSLGALIMVVLLSAVLLLDSYVMPVAHRVDAVLAPPSPPPPFLHKDMTSPRFRERAVDMLPFTDMESGKAGTLLTWASIDRNGAISYLEIIERSGDEEMLGKTLEALRSNGFEPARLGDQTVAVNFLYLFTTTEVRPTSKPTISDTAGGLPALS